MFTCYDNEKVGCNIPCKMRARPARRQTLFRRFSRGQTGRQERKEIFPDFRPAADWIGNKRDFTRETHQVNPCQFNRLLAKRYVTWCLCSNPHISGFVPPLRTIPTIPPLTIYQLADTSRPTESWELGNPRPAAGAGQKRKESKRTELCERNSFVHTNSPKRDN